MIHSKVHFALQQCQKNSRNQKTEKVWRKKSFETEFLAEPLKFSLIRRCDVDRISFEFSHKVPKNRERNYDVEREKSRELDCFEINCIWSSLGELKL
jgi:hypothetical protein